jgi:hypothetical protein
VSTTSRRSLVGFDQSSRNSRRESVQAVFQNIVGSAASQELDRPLFAHRPRDQDERSLGVLPLKDRKCTAAIEPRKRVVRQDELGLELLELTNVVLQRFDTLELEAEPRGSQLADDQRAVGIAVLEMQNANRLTLILAGSIGSIGFSKLLLERANVAVAPGIGFGEYGDDHVRFALIENEARTRQAVRGIKEMFRKDGLL